MKYRFKKSCVMPIWGEYFGCKTHIFMISWNGSSLYVYSLLKLYWYICVWYGKMLLVYILYGWYWQLALSIICRYDWSVSRIRHSFKFVQNRSKIFCYGLIRWRTRKFRTTKKKFKDILVRFNVSQTCVYYNLIG